MMPQRGNLLVAVDALGWAIGRLGGAAFGIDSSTVEDVFPKLFVVAVSELLDGEVRRRETDMERGLGANFAIEIVE